MAHGTREACCGAANERTPRGVRGAGRALLASCNQDAPRMSQSKGVALVYIYGSVVFTEGPADNVAPRQARALLAR